MAFSFLVIIFYFSGVNSKADVVATGEESDKMKFNFPEIISAKKRHRKENFSEGNFIISMRFIIASKAIPLSRFETL